MKTRLLIAALIIPTLATAQNWSGSTVPTTTGDYNTSIQLITTPWGAQHGLLFNAYRSNPLVNGSLSAFGNTKHSFDVGPFGSGAGAIMYLGNGGSMEFLISNTSTGANTNVDWGIPKMIIKRTGLVGIGTSNPVGKLDINHAGGQIRLSGGTVAGGVWTNATDILYLADWSTGTKGLNINMSSGNIGIGTANPDFKLTVNGKIKTEEVQVVVDVPADYVFESGYSLMPLMELEMFVTQNKHLPGMPDAQSLIANGWQIGEMHNKLLEKVEELTLYMIELKKENEDLKKRLTKIEGIR